MEVLAAERGRRDTSLYFYQLLHTLGVFPVRVRSEGRRSRAAMVCSPLRVAGAALPWPRSPVGSSDSDGGGCNGRIAMEKPNPVGERTADELAGAEPRTWAGVPADFAVWDGNGQCRFRPSEISSGAYRTGENSKSHRGRPR